MIAAWIMVTIGIGLFLFSLLGSMTNLGHYKNNDAQDWDSFDHTLPPRTSSMKSLQAYASVKISNDLPSEQIMDVLHEIVLNRFVHGEQAYYNFFSNWILCLLGYANTAFTAIRDPDMLLRNGHSALCSEQSYLLLILAERFGIKARHVGLNGHVVMEAWYGGKWHMYDPDLEVVPDVSGRGILSVYELSRDPVLLQSLYQKHGNSIVQIFVSREDNTFMSFPRLAHFEWKTNVLSYFERIANRLKWFVPMIILVIGVLILLWRR